MTKKTELCLRLPGYPEMVFSFDETFSGIIRGTSPLEFIQCAVKVEDGIKHIQLWDNGEVIFHQMIEL